MAKKAETKGKQGGGKGRKLCNPTDGQSCGNYIGARAGTCPKCKKPQLMKGKRARKQKQKQKQQEASSAGQPKEEEIIALIQKMGSAERVKEVLGGLAGYDVRGVIAGVKRVERFLTLLQDLQAKK